MITINSNKKKEKIEIETKFASTFWQQLKGLMFSREKNFAYCLVFPFKTQSRFHNAIHTLFVFFPIVAVFLDENKRVVDIKKMVPFMPLYVPKKDCAYLLEMPLQFEKKIKLGDKVDWGI